MRQATAAARSDAIWESDPEPFRSRLVPADRRAADPQDRLAHARKRPVPRRGPRFCAEGAFSRSAWQTRHRGRAGNGRSLDDGAPSPRGCRSGDPGVGFDGIDRARSPRGARGGIVKDSTHSRCGWRGLTWAGVDWQRGSSGGTNGEPALPSSSDRSACASSRRRRQDARTLVAGVLRSEGYEVVEANDGRELVDLVESAFWARSRRGGSVSLVLTDVRMPEFSGIDVLWILRATSREVPVILMGTWRTTLRASRRASSAPTPFCGNPRPRGAAEGRPGDPPRWVSRPGRRSHLS